MSSSVSMLDIARRALSAQQMGLTVTGHNIANVNTPGYSRQRVVMEASNPHWSKHGYLGAGVSVSTIERVRDGFIDTEIRSEHQSLGRWEYRQRIFSEVEGIFNEPSDLGLSSVLNDFWDSWNTLANDPQSDATKSNVRQVAHRLVDTLHHQNDRLASLQGSLSEDLDTKVSEMNSILHQVANLNEKISSVQDKSVMANDYHDQRNLLIEELSTMADVSFHEDSLGMATVSVGGHTLVERNSVFELGVESNSRNGIVVKDVVWKEDGSTVSFSSGKIQGLIEMRDEVIPELLDKLDQVAIALVNGVNTIHQRGQDASGATGYDFFDAGTTGAENIALDSNVLDDVSNIMASADGSPGNNSIALQIAQFSDSKVMSGATVSVGDYFAAMMGTLGVASQEAQFMQENQTLMVEYLQNQQSSISGVSLDEEMTNLMKYQHAYEAAARLVTTVDEMMQTILGMV